MSGLVETEFPDGWVRGDRVVLARTHGSFPDALKKRKGAPARVETVEVDDRGKVTQALVSFYGDEGKHRAWVSVRYLDRLEEVDRATAVYAVAVAVMNELVEIRTEHGIDAVTTTATHLVQSFRAGERWFELAMLLAVMSAALEGRTVSVRANRVAELPGIQGLLDEAREMVRVCAPDLG